jgi:DNA gyrase/topoisomerase IV subunit A
VSAQRIEDSVILALLKIANDSDLRKEALNDVNKQILEEIEAFDKEKKILMKDARDLREKIEHIEDLLKSPTGNKEKLKRELKPLTAKYEEYDRLLTEARIKEMTLGQKLITDRELERALIVNLPIWETLFPQEKHKVLKLISQILALLSLCPVIQKEILLSKDKKLCALGEYNVREIIKEPLWEKQIEMWDALLRQP